jgi:hypothetical protein
MYLLAFAVAAVAVVVVVLIRGGSDTRDTAGGTAGASSGRAVVWAVGDGADGGKRARTLAQVIEAGRPDHFLYLGDVYPSGSAGAFRRKYVPVYGSLARKTSPTPGNHEWPRRTEGYFPYWRRAKGRAQPAYYSFRAGGWEILSLNSEGPHDAGSPQLRWLRGKLARRGGTCRLAFWHRARFSAGSHGDAPDLQPFWDALRGRAAIVVTAHDHNLQRMKPQDGIVHFVAGGGGHGHYELDEGYPRLAWSNETTYGALRLMLTPGRADYRFVSERGGTLDSGSISCDP